MKPSSKTFIVSQDAMSGKDPAGSFHSAASNSNSSPRQEVQTSNEANDFLCNNKQVSVNEAM